MSGFARAAFAALALALCGSAARADDPTRRGFDADVTRPALFLDRGLSVETAAAGRAGEWAAGLRLELLDGFFALTVRNERDQLLEQRLTAHLSGVRTFSRFELAADLPIVLWQKADFSLLERAGVTGPLVDPVATTTLGDLRLGGKLPILTAAQYPIALSAVAELRLPTGDGKSFASDGLLFAPGAVGTMTFGPLRVDAQMAYRFRRPGQYAQLVVHDGLAFGAGASVPLPAIGKLKDWRAHAELAGELPRGIDLQSSRYRSPLTALAGLRIGVASRWQVEVGGSSGLGPPGFGRESWRLFVGLRFVHPPSVDTDGDGVPDVDDLCPTVPGPAANFGCPDGAPELDADHDGVPIPLDRCPNEPGPAELDGCPDRDGDGIPDIEDKCPDQPGPATNDGCPLGEEPLVEVEAERLSLKDAINFETGKDTILPKSDRILDSIAAILKANADIQRVRVEGHTDNVGTAAYNKDLSQRRAASVVRALVARGIEAGKLLPVGYGFDRPVDTNATALGRAKNRRVEFTILQPGEGAEK
jgi:OOP family OmpA-OmpF porin